MSRQPNPYPPQRTRALPKRDPARSVALGYVHPGEVSSYFLQSMLGAVLYDRANGQQITNIFNEWSSANISNARNRIVRAFLDQGDADWLLFVDSDMAFEVNAVSSMLAVADPETVPILGALCFGADEDGLFPTVYNLVETDDGFITMRMNDYPRDALIRCAATGAAFLMVHRRVFAEMLAHGYNRAFPWFQETHVGDRPMSEDITFCLRAAGLKVPVHVNAAVKIGHHKSRVLTEDEFDRQPARAGVPLAEVGPVEEVADGAAQSG